MIFMLIMKGDTMKEIKIVTLMLVLILTFSTLVGCGNSNQAVDESKSGTNVEANNDGTTVTEANEESTTVEETSSVSIYNERKELPYTLWDGSTISAETKIMLLEKLTYFSIKKGEKFDMNSLPFKENEQTAREAMRARMHGMLDPSKAVQKGNILECMYDKVEIYKVEVLTDRIVFYARQYYVR